MPVKGDERMSYDPPSQQPGGSTPPEGDAGGSSTPPPSGGYTPPPGSSGGYTPPPSAGGYTPPPSGGYTPPPPPGGGYSPPPPPPGPGPGGPNIAGMDQAGLQNLAQSYLNAVTKPNVSTYEAEMRNGTWVKILIGVAAVAVVRFIVALLGVGTASASLGPLRDQLRAQGINFDPGAFTGGVGVGAAISSLFFTFISFFVGAGVLFLMAKIFGGQGSDFMTHAYLLSLIYVPVQIASSILNIIPFIGLLTIVLYIYQLYSQGLSMQASQRLNTSRAMLAAFLPTVIGFVLLCLGLLLCAGLIAAALGGAINR